MSFEKEARGGRCAPWEEGLRASGGGGTTGVLRVTTIVHVYGVVIDMFGQI